MSISTERITHNIHRYTQLFETHLKSSKPQEDIRFTKNVNIYLHVNIYL